MADEPQVEQPTPQPVSPETPPPAPPELPPPKDGAPIKIEIRTIVREQRDRYG